MTQSELNEYFRKLRILLKGKTFCGGRGVNIVINHVSKAMSLKDKSIAASMTVFVYLNITRTSEHSLQVLEKLREKDFVDEFRPKQSLSETDPYKRIFDTDLFIYKKNGSWKDRKENNMTFEQFIIHDPQVSSILLEDEDDHYAKLHSP